LQIEKLIEMRTGAKKEKDFAAADTLREELIRLGVAIMDFPEGTAWEKI